MMDDKQTTFKDSSKFTILYVPAPWYQMAHFSTVSALGESILARSFSEKGLPKGGTFSNWAEKMGHLFHPRILQNKEENM